MSDANHEVQTLLEDLPADVRQSLLHGYEAGPLWMKIDVNPHELDFELDQQAYEDGRLLGNALRMLQSADLVDYAADKREYGRIAAELNRRYGAGLVVTIDQLGVGGAIPGFRQPDL